MHPKNETSMIMHKTAAARKPRPVGKDARLSDAEYLTRLGERVRETRARRGMTRKILARDSDVSERYLAQLEAGQGNISIILLRQVAQAMNVPLEDLVGETPERPIELTLLLQMLGRLAPAELARAREMLAREFGQARKRAGLVALVGLRGGGKSTLGAAVAQRLGVPFIELDREIERESGQSLAEMFDLIGQAGYRRWERRCLEQIIQRHDRAIVTTGGSIVSEPATFELLLSACYTVWIKARPEEHMARVLAQGDRRPMADNGEAMADLKRILATRNALYGKADASLDTSGKTVAQSAAALAALLER